MTEKCRSWVAALLLEIVGVGWAVGQRSPVETAIADAPGGPSAAKVETSHRAGGSISGKLTDLGSRPVPAVSILARNEATGVETHTISSRNGSYRLTGLEAGQYTLEASSPVLGRGRLQGIYVAGGYEARIQAAMAFEAAAAEPPAVLLAAEPAKLPPRSAAAAALESSSATVWAPLPLGMGEPQSLPLEGHSTQPRVSLETVTAELEASIQDEPLQRLLMAGHERLAASAPSAVGIRSANREAMALGVAVAAVRSAAEFSHPFPAAASPTSEPGDPLSPIVNLPVSGTELQSLPAAGRRWQDIVPNSPNGNTGSAEESSKPAVEGAAETTIDGASTRLAFGDERSSRSSTDEAGGGAEESGAAGMGRVWSGAKGSPIAEAAIRKVATAAYSALGEGSRGNGGGLSIDTMHGVNGLHGQAFGFDRQNTWGARNPFTQWVRQTAPATLSTPPVFTAEPYTPSDHETVRGFGAGGQLKRDKLFWFAALDSFRRNNPGLATVRHPDLFFAQPANDQMQVLSARLGLSGVNPIAEGLAAYSRLLTTLGGLLGPAPRSSTQWVAFARVDGATGERHRFTVEGNGAHWNSPGGGLTRVSEPFGSNSFGATAATEETILGRWEAFITANLLVVTQASVGRTIHTAKAPVPSTYEQTFLRANSWGQLPQINIDARDGFTIGNPARFGTGSYPDEKVLHAQEAMSWIHGSLQVKGGGELSHNADATSLLRNQTGTYSYSSVESFASDALAFASFGLVGQLNPNDQHNCDQTGRVWRDSSGTLRGLGYLPCYSYYSQTLGPTNWNLSTNDWAGYTTLQWQPSRLAVMSASLRSERQQLPPPIPAVDNPGLPLTERLPALGNRWGPRFSLALGRAESHWPVLRLGYGMYFGRVENSTVETALTHTGSSKGDLNFFMRPTDNLHSGGAPPFPYVLSGAPASIVKPGAVEFASNFRNPEVHQAVVAIEEELPGHVQITVSGQVSLARSLPISIDTNIDPAVNPGSLTYAVVDGSGLGPIKTTQVTVPFYASWPAAHTATGFAGRLNSAYQQITAIMSKANSTYEAASLTVSHTSRRGLSLHARYTFAHAADWNPNESNSIAGSDVLDPGNFREEYGASDLDMRQSATVRAVLEAPWKLGGLEGRLANKWRLSGVGQFHSGLPYTMRTSGRLAEGFNRETGTAIVALGPGMNGSGGDNRVYGVGRNTYRYPAPWKADLRIAKTVDLGQVRQLEMMIESFNLFNHQNVTELETTGYSIQPGDLNGSLPTLNFLTGLKANTTEFGKPLNVDGTNSFRERQVQIGLRLRF